MDLIFVLGRVAAGERARKGLRHDAVSWSWPGVQDARGLACMDRRLGVGLTPRHLERFRLGFNGVDVQAARGHPKISPHVSGYGDGSRRRC